MTVFRHFCEFCGTPFASRAPAQRYCNGKCKLKARHQRAIKRYEAQNTENEAS